MRPHVAASLLLTAVVASCGDGTGPEPTRAPGSVSIKPCARVLSSFDAIWFAYRNGDGPWTQVSPDASGTYKFEAEANASLAYSYRTAENIRVTRIVNASGAELALIGLELCTARAGTASLTGSAVVSGGGGAIIGAANQVALVSIPSTGQATWSLSNLSGASTDLVAIGGSDGTLPGGERWIVRRGIVPGIQAVPALDFTAAEAQTAPPLHSISFSGAPTGARVDVLAYLISSGGTAFPLLGRTSVASPQTMTAMPASLRAPGDLYTVALNMIGLGGGDFRDIYIGYSDPAAQSVVFGPAIGTPTFSAITPAPYPRMRAVFASQADYPDAAQIEFHESFSEVTVTTTAAYLGGRPSTWELEIPDLTAAGYQASWGVPDVPRASVAKAINGSAHILLDEVARKGETATVGLRQVIQGTPASASIRRQP